MDYEKKYKEALEVAQKLYQDCPNGKNDRLYYTTDLEKMFPELRESEDEKIRKELIEHVKDQQSTFISAPDCRDKYEEEENNKYNVWIAWLEKQGRQKPQRMISAEAKEVLLNESEREALRTEYEKGRADAIAEIQKEWSEEDKEMCQETIDWFEKKCFPYALESENPARESIKWLKTLKQRITPGTTTTRT